MQKDYSEFDKRKELIKILFEDEITEQDFELPVAGSSDITKYEKENQNEHNNK
jgi:hypothetical protein